MADGTTSYGYDNANRLTNVNGVTYSWDNNGNLLNDGAKTYGYDQANRLKQVVQGAITTTFAYNGVGDRLSQTVGITTTRYVLDPAAGLTQVLADGTNTYLYGVGRIAQYQASMQYFGPDGLGSVRQIYDASGMVVGSSRYDPYGNVMSQSGTATSVFAFAGEQQDAGTGLEYLRARYYSSAQGRFTTRDVWEGDYQRPQSLNGWAYAEGNPVGYADPSGRCRDCSRLGPIARAILTWLGQCLPAEPGPTETPPPTKVGQAVTPTLPPTGTPTQPPTATPVVSSDDVEAASFAIGAEMDFGGKLASGDQFAVTTTDKRQVFVVSNIWGDDRNRDPVFAALVGVIRNRVDMQKSGQMRFRGCGTTPTAASCARSPDFEAQWRGTRYMPDEHDRSLTSQVLNGQRSILYPTAVSFNSPPQPARSGSLGYESNLAHIDPNVRDSLAKKNGKGTPTTPLGQFGFYFYASP